MGTSSEDLLEMEVEETGFLLERLGEDCHPLQQIRELTQNAIEAVARARAAGLLVGPGEILWDMDEEMYKHEGVSKLCIIDNGDGMNPEDFKKYINRLSSSKGKQAITANYGVGGKITALIQNPEGVIYRSWKGGTGYGATLQRARTQSGETPRYGLRLMGDANERNYFIELLDDEKPVLIKEHGTKVTLLGKSPKSDTTQGIDGNSKGSWITKYLNTRYYRIPENVVLKAAESWNTEHYQQIQIHGHLHFLKEASIASGTVDLDRAKAHWWILSEKEMENQRNKLEYHATGHTAAIYQDELYEMTRIGRESSYRLADFGVYAAQRRVVIYVEPNTEGLTSNTARTELLRDKDRLPWAEWGVEFDQKMPKAIKDLIEEQVDKTNVEDDKAIRDRLKQLKDIYQVSRFKEMSGPHRADPTQPIMNQEVIGGDTEITEIQRFLPEFTVPDPEDDTVVDPPDHPKTPGGKGNLAERTLLRSKKRNGVQSRRTNTSNPPQVIWLTRGKKFKGSMCRDEGQLEDRPAQWVKNKNIILANADFRFFTDVVKSVLKERKDKGEAAEKYAAQRVRHWYQHLLVETVIRLEAVINEPCWKPTSVDKALSEEGLTSAMAPVWFVHNQVVREMGSKFGSFKKSRDTEQEK